VAARCDESAAERLGITSETGKHVSIWEKLDA
jgi:hypothetical protein